MTDKRHEGGISERKENRDEPLSELRELGIGAILHNAASKDNDWIDSNTFKRLEMDLVTNKTADYTRINLNEVYVFLGCDAKMAATHWRLSKIMDAIAMCKNQLGVTKEGLAASEIPNKLYKPILEGRVNEKIWPIEMICPTSIKEDGFPKNINVNVSFSDFAHLMDVLKTNRELGANKMSLNEILYRFFIIFGEPKVENSNSIEMKVVLKDDKGQAIVSDEENEGGGKKVINLLDSKFNPRDDYKNFKELLGEYKHHIKDYDISEGLEMLASWRFDSAGHRENGGHAMMITMDGELFYVPVSGRMAAAITLDDFQKMDKSGADSQPHETAEIDENTGAAIRFNMADLTQRLKGGDIRSFSGTQRLAKAMVGVALGENAMNFVTEEENEKKKAKKIIHLCGKKLDSNVISGVHHHYDKASEKITGRKLSDKEAADIVFTDVFAPCILTNNENDWLLAMAKTFGLKSGQTLIANKYREFEDFELRIWCRDLDSGEIVEKPFTNMKDLRYYLDRRIDRGDIDQPLEYILSREGAGVKEKEADENKKINPDVLFGQPGKGKLKDEWQYEVSNSEGQNFGEIIKNLLEIYGYEDNFKQYIAKGSSSAIHPSYVVDGKIVKPNEKVAGRIMDIPFHLNLSNLLLAIPVNEKDAFLLKIFNKYTFDGTEPDHEAMLKGFIQTIENLNGEQRKKIKF